MSADDGRPPSNDLFDGLDFDEGPLLFIREVLTSVLTVLAVGLILFAISGVWPPMVAVESGSMEPHMHKGDLVFISGPDRYVPDAAVDGTAVVTAETGAEVGYRSFGGDGSVVVYHDPGAAGPPIIHRAMFHVEKGENWYDKANSDYISAENCEQLAHCPAPYDAFITKGDNNPRYDQVSSISDPVRPEWIQGIARIRIPFLGWVRLTLANTLTVSPVTPETAGLMATPPTDAGSSIALDHAAEQAAVAESESSISVSGVSGVSAVEVTTTTPETERSRTELKTAGTERNASGSKSESRAASNPPSGAVAA
ncbi:signal sequence peptidase [Haloferax mucosum ATCC BAA-1512]|uniref:Signal sequence peptidase n=1 Tax=Haloferax mucosum ATCC BAA-1512 TaxID=662479 RepID=M0IET1_9EURY|nr:S26 family signal peptidase [Haloferax mucosum]ELZ95281.1 signal sequence peptidase [Haloferax mucosum ATCC BAA-1512]